MTVPNQGPEYSPRYIMLTCKGWSKVKCRNFEPRRSKALRQRPLGAPFGARALVATVSICLAYLFETSPGTLFLSPLEIQAKEGANSATHTYGVKTRAYWAEPP